MLSITQRLNLLTIRQWQTENHMYLIYPHISVICVCYRCPYHFFFLFLSKINQKNHVRIWESIHVNRTIFTWLGIKYALKCAENDFAFFGCCCVIFHGKFVWNALFPWFSSYAYKIIQVKISVVFSYEKLKSHFHFTCLRRTKRRERWYWTSGATRTAR